MIESEILEIVEDSTDTGERLNALVDQFRRGRDIGHVGVLLESSRPELASIGAWVLSELPVSLYASQGLLQRLRTLLEHEDPAVRFHAFSALYPTLDSEDVATRELLRKLSTDPNDGVRRCVEAAAARIGLI